MGADGGLLPGLSAHGAGEASGSGGATVKLSRRHRKILRAAACGHRIMQDRSSADQPWGSSLLEWQDDHRVGWRTTEDLKCWELMDAHMDMGAHHNGLLVWTITPKGRAALRNEAQAK